MPKPHVFTKQNPPVHWSHGGWWIDASQWDVSRCDGTENLRGTCDKTNWYFSHSHVEAKKKMERENMKEWKIHWADLICPNKPSVHSRPAESQPNSSEEGCIQSADQKCAKTPESSMRPRANPHKIQEPNKDNFMLLIFWALNLLKYRDYNCIYKEVRLIENRWPWLQSGQCPRELCVGHCAVHPHNKVEKDHHRFNSLGI